ncbi:MAG: hydrogenase maturation protease [Actinomycetota bacterium]|nr:hydrogenase maturation protease [Actinomycetota bacterium]
MHASAETSVLPAGFLGSATSLVLGIGNSGRQDDGLGWAYLDALEDGAGVPAQLRRTYQLNLEDADLIHRYQRVLFVDATKDAGVASFSVTRPHPRMDLTFTSHAISVPAILATAQQCFDTIPEAYLLAIRGYEWELREGITEPARRNLRLALDATRDAAVHEK